jgi:hydrogenase maturation protein HypF
MSSVLTPPSARMERLRLRAEGAVQGVGFRPWVLRQAQSLGLSGWVRNDGAGLLCELQGLPQALLQFQARLATEPPPLARIRRLQRQRLLPLAEERGFHIESSSQGARMVALVPPDAATCEACLDEMFTPDQRRWRHPFINCTQCGPRFTLTDHLPYDRSATSMADFLMCDDCAAEYTLPTDRRYHAQPIACPQCGPRIALWSPQGEVLIDAAQGPDAVVAEAVRRLRAGQILAVKGVGGYHLVADALQTAPLQRLREAKHRASKPFAVMAANVASARRWLQVDDDAAALLHSPARPVVLQRCRPEAAAAHPLIAPDLTEWGLMLPSHPLQWLLLHDWAGRPADPRWRDQPLDALLVMTSANPGGEPLVIDEAEAVSRLGGLADALLVHDRAILARADDSVRRPLGSDAQGRFFAPFIRRARGYVPEPIELPGVAANAPSVLAMGGDLKDTLCLTRGNQAFLSPHLGDMGSAASREGLSAMVERLCRFLAVRPSLVVHDLHPDFFSTRHGQALAAQWRVPTLAVQHHHAHAAAVLAEQGHSGPALGLVLDGVGLGSDGTPWGGEWLLLDDTAPGVSFTRLAHLPPLPLPGGDRAAREPWRMGAAMLYALGRGDDIARRFASEAAAPSLPALLAKGLNCPLTASVGRLFDAAAALLLGLHHNRHEAEAAMRLEAAAAQHGAAEPWPDTLRLDAQGQPDLTGLWRALVDAPMSMRDPAAACEAAARFHASLAQILVATTLCHARAQRLRTVALGGGCWINRILRETVTQALRAQGLHILEATQAPCGDGGLSLGQAAVALARQAPHPGRRPL